VPRRRFARVTLAAGCVAALVGGALVWRARRAAAPSPQARPLAPIRAFDSMPREVRALEVRKQKAANPPQAPTEAAEESEPLPGSLEGTEVDGWLGVDDDGHLVVTPGARWFFDYFLSATGEEPPEQIRGRIVAEIKKRLPAAGAQEAIDLLDRYLAYRDRVRALQASGAPAEAQERLAQLHDVRRETFGDADAAALFGEEEQMQAVDIERRQVLSDQTLAPDERDRKLAALEEQLPAAAVQARSEAMTLIRLQADEEQLREAGGSADDIHALREQRFGTEAAARLDALDRERAAWQQRLDDYRSAREEIEGNSTLTPNARARAVEALLGERFTPQERLRVEALDTLRAAGH
jgi:lipase chaperone LimK